MAPIGDKQNYSSPAIMKTSFGIKLALYISEGAKQER
jgi:hypothetical protein